MTASFPRRGSGSHLGDALSALLDGELPPDDEAPALYHLAACAACRAELDDVRTARAWVRALPSVEPPAGFIERLLADETGVGEDLEIGDEARVPAAASPTSLAARRRWTSRRALAALAASAAAGIGLLGLAHPREAPVSPAVAQLVEAHATGASLEGDPLSRLAPIGVPVTFTR
jgi:anti-sigma factor RsiW